MADNSFTSRLRKKLLDRSRSVSSLSRSDSVTNSLPPDLSESKKKSHHQSPSSSSSSSSSKDASLLSTTTTSSSSITSLDSSSSSSSSSLASLSPSSPRPLPSSPPAPPQSPLRSSPPGLSPLRVSPPPIPPRKNSLNAKSPGPSPLKAIPPYRSSDSEDTTTPPASPRLKTPASPAAPLLFSLIHASHSDSAGTATPGRRRAFAVDLSAAAEESPPLRLSGSFQSLQSDDRDEPLGPPVSPLLQTESLADATLAFFFPDDPPSQPFHRRSSSGSHLLGEPKVIHLPSRKEHRRAKVLQRQALRLAGSRILPSVPQALADPEHPKPGTPPSPSLHPAAQQGNRHGSANSDTLSQVVTPTSVSSLTTQINRRKTKCRSVLHRKKAEPLKKSRRPSSADLSNIREVVDSYYERQVAESKHLCDLQLAKLSAEMTKLPSLHSEEILAHIRAILDMDGASWCNPTRSQAVITPAVQLLANFPKGSLERGWILQLLMIVSEVSNAAMYFNIQESPNERSQFFLRSAKAVKLQHQCDLELVKSLTPQHHSSPPPSEHPTLHQPKPLAWAVPKEPAPPPPSPLPEGMTLPPTPPAPQRDNNPGPPAHQTSHVPPLRPPAIDLTPVNPVAPADPELPSPLQSPRWHKVDRSSHEQPRMRLCRICENNIPSARFSSHSEVCCKYSKMETQIHFINESLNRVLADTTKRGPSVKAVPEEYLSPLQQLIVRVLGTRSSTSDDQAQICGASLRLLVELIGNIRKKGNIPTDLFLATASLIQKKQHILKSQKNRMLHLQEDFSGFSFHRHQLLVSGERHHAGSLSPQTNLIRRDIARERQQASHRLRTDSIFSSRPVSPTSPLKNSDGLSASSGGTKRSMMSIADFQIIKPISRGSFGQVVLARKKATGDIYAIKIQKKSEMIRKNQDKYARNERNVLAMTHGCPYVVKLFYSFQSVDSLFLVMEYLNGGDCFSLLRVFGSFAEPMVKQYIGETTLALEYLHAHGIVHRDLKPDNMLIGSDGHIKLTDFGLSAIGLVDRQQEMRSKVTWQSQMCQDADETNTVDLSQELVGTPDYIAPEIFLGLPYGPAVDWWSLGCICYEFFVGVTPFYGDTIEEVMSRTLEGIIQWPAEGETDLSDAAICMISKLLTLDPTQRLGANGAQDVKDQPFFQDIKWDQLSEMRAQFVPAPDSISDTSYFDARNEVWTPDANIASSLEAESNSPQIQSIDEATARKFRRFSFINLELLHAVDQSPR